MSETLKVTAQEVIDPNETRESDSVPEFLEDPNKRIEIAIAIVNDTENMPRTGEELLDLIRATQIDVRTDELKLMIASDSPTGDQRIDIVRLGDMINEQWIARVNGVVNSSESRANDLLDGTEANETITPNNEVATTPTEIIENVDVSFDDEKNVPRTSSELLELMRVTQIAVAKAELAQMRSSDIPTTNKEKVIDMVGIANNIYKKGTNSLRDINYLEENGLAIEGSNSQRRERCRLDKATKAELERNSQYNELLKNYFGDSGEGLSPEDVEKELKQKAQKVIEKIYGDIKTKNLAEYGIDDINVLEEYEGILCLERFPDNPNDMKKIFAEARERSLL